MAQSGFLTGADLLTMVGRARSFLAALGLKRGDRCALLAQNGVRWIAMDLAIMAEGLIAVPLYARQAPAELVAMMKDCSPALICCGDTVRDWHQPKAGPEAPPQIFFVDEIFLRLLRAKRAVKFCRCRSGHHYLHLRNFG